MRHAPPPATERRDAEPVTESLRETASRVGRAVSAWLAMGLLVPGPAVVLARVAEESAGTVYVSSGLALSVVGAWAVLRFRPGAVDRVWRFAVIAFVVFLTVLFLAPPTWNTGSIRQGSALVALLAWTVGVLVASAVAYRDVVDVQ